MREHGAMPRRALACCLALCLLMGAAALAETPSAGGKTLRIAMIEVAEGAKSSPVDVGTYWSEGHLMPVDAETQEALAYDSLYMKMAHKDAPEAVWRVVYIERTPDSEAEGAPPAYVFFLVPTGEPNVFVMGLDSDQAYEYELEDGVLTIHADSQTQMFLFEKEEQTLLYSVNLGMGLIVTGIYEEPGEE